MQAFASFATFAFTETTFMESTLTCSVVQASARAALSANYNKFHAFNEEEDEGKKDGPDHQ